MPSPEVLDFESLLKPFEVPTPSGKDLRADPSPTSLYQILKEARRAARQLETSISRGDPDVPTPEWRPVVERATQILREQSKDLEVCAYMIEGLARLHGFAGIRDGYRLARELVERFWENGLYPSPGEADVERRCAHILQLNGLDGTGALVPPIARIPFTEMTSLGQYSRVQMQEAQALEKIGDPKVRQAKIEDGMISLAKIQQAVGETRSEFYEALFQDISLAEDEFKRFNEAVRERSGLDEATGEYNYDPPSGNLLQAVQEYVDIVKNLTRSKAPPKPKDAKSPKGEADARKEDAGGDGHRENGAIASREDALGRILGVADFFRRTEPQSIIPYALEQVVHWGKLSLPELLSELIADEGPRKNVFKQVGIKPPEPQTQKK